MILFISIDGSDDSRKRSLFRIGTAKPISASIKCSERERVQRTSFSLSFVLSLSLSAVLSPSLACNLPPPRLNLFPSLASDHTSTPRLPHQRHRRSLEFWTVFYRLFSHVTINSFVHLLTRYRYYLLDCRVTPKGIHQRVCYMSKSCRASLFKNVSRVLRSKEKARTCTI